MNHRYALRTEDGKQLWRRFSDEQMLASKGDLLSTVEYRQNMLLAHNHNTGRAVLLPKAMDFVGWVQRAVPIWATTPMVVAMRPRS